MRQAHVNTAFHIPVLRDDVLELLINEPNGVYVDGTLGGGGHAERIIEKIFPHGTLIGIDADADALQTAHKRLQRFGAHCICVNDNHANIRAILHSLNISKINGLLLDLGVSSFQLDEGSKGFSFRADDLLDMRMDQRQIVDAGLIVNTYSEGELADIFWKYGEEKNSRRIARDIVESRQSKRIETTGELAGVVGKRLRGPFLTKTLARVFQALRIEVNNELVSLRRALQETEDLLATGGRMVVISYHSLEDRIVKSFFQEKASDRIPSGHKLIADTPITPTLRVLTKKPLVPSKEEQRSNPRSRSAKLRAAEKI